MIVDIFRHAQSTANIGLPIEGSPADIPLTAKGEAQAVALSKTFDPSQPPALIVVSDYLRTQQTAGPTIALFPQVPREIWPVEEFTQLAHAKYKGTSWSDRTSDSEGYWDRNDPDYIDGPGAESFNQMAARIEDTVERLSRMKNQRVFIFSHGMFMRALFLRITRPELDGKGLMQAVNESRHTIKMPNTARIRLSLSDHGKLIPGFAPVAA